MRSDGGSEVETDCEKDAPIRKKLKTLTGSVAHLDSSVSDPDSDYERDIAEISMTEADLIDDHNNSMLSQGSRESNQSELPSTPQFSRSTNKTDFNDTTKSFSATQSSTTLNLGNMENFIPVEVRILCLFITLPLNYIEEFCVYYITSELLNIA